MSLLVLVWFIVTSHFVVYFIVTPIAFSNLKRGNLHTDKYPEIWSYHPNSTGIKSSGYETSYSFQDFANNL